MTNIEKSFYCLGQASNKCFNCSYCRAIDTCENNIVYDILPSEINSKFVNLPVAINLFYGDPLLQLNNTLNYLYRLEQAGHKGIVTIITKGDFSQFPDIPFNLDLHIAFSTFGKNHEYDGGGWERFINNLNCIKKRKYNYKYSIEFRPICYGINDDIETIERVIKVASEYDLSIGYSGLQGKPDIVKYWKENNIELKPYPDYTFGHKKPLSNEVEGKLRELAQKYRVNLFSKTSCLLSYVHNKDRDYNCHYYRPNEVRCDLCPMFSKCKEVKSEIRKIELPFDYKLEYKKGYECILSKTGKCNYPSENCKSIEGYVIKTDKQLTIADYRMIKWLTGYVVDNDFEYIQELSNFWYESWVGRKQEKKGNT